MKLESVNVQNFLGLHDFRHKPSAPIAVPFGDVTVTCTRRKP